MSIVAGLQVPAMPLPDVAGSDGAVCPAQSDRAFPKLKVGVTLGVTVTVKVNTGAQTPAVGVNT